MRQEMISRIGLLGAAMSVHNSLGPGYKEEVYEQALAAELRARDIPAQSQQPIQVWHADQFVALFYLDLMVGDQVVVEVKAFPHQFTNDELGQIIGYLKASRAPVGLLLNFGRRRLEYRRVFPGASEDLPRRIGRDDIRRSK